EIFNDRVLQTYRESDFSGPGNTIEHKLVVVFKETLGLDKDIDIDMPILDTGITSVDLIRLKRVVEVGFGIEDIPMITIMTNTIIRSLAAAVQKLKVSHLTTGCHTTVKTPLWLFHPGVGEILVFLALAQHFPDRPIYAMRPRGFNSGDETF
ncbi:Thioesterase, partial [Penicillium cf. viridicatum]